MWKFVTGASKPKDLDKDAKRKAYSDDYEKNKRPMRDFRLEWTEGRPWLKNSTDQGMTCTYCTAQKFNNNFVSGCTSGKKDSITKHEKSDQHRRAEAIYIAKTKPRSSSEAGKIIQTLNAAAFEKLNHMFRTCHALVMNDRPLSDFDWICDLDEAKGLVIGKTYRHTTNSYSPKQFVHAIAETAYQTVSETITNSRFMCLIGDGSTDSAIIEQEMLTQYHIIK